MVATPGSNGQTTPALTAGQLLQALESAAAYLTANAAAIDAINVYPVPDGDTGSNMAATMREAVEGAAGNVDAGAAAVLEGLAHGALYGARGNSGVILSQALRGLADGAANASALDGPQLARALEAAAAAAYAAVAKPVEGTMLTVLRAAAEGATAAAASTGDAAGCLPVLRAALAAAEAAEDRTPEQLPALAEAGVTDAGGEGVCTILRGLVAALAGAPMPPIAAVSGVQLARAAGHAADEYGYCTEFVIEPVSGSLDLGRIRSLVEAGNRSVVVVGDPSAARVHVHTDDAEGLLAAVREVGTVSRVKIDDMTAQHARWTATGSGAIAGVALLALSPGPGFDAIYESLGAVPFRLNVEAKPSAGELAAAADRLQRPTVFILPAHENVMLAARQAVALARCELRVVDAETTPQAIAAALAFDPAATVAANAAAMERARTTAGTVEVTVAAASRTAEGVPVRAGQAIAIANGRLAGAADAPLDALLIGLEAAGAREAGLVTVYLGEAAPPADEVLAAVQALNHEVEVISGGQPLYPFIASVER
jgi:DAK2 domain fusion protein YloV